MEVKEVKPARIFYHEETTTLAGIHDIAVREIDNMYVEAQKAGMKEVAPMQFVYYGINDDPQGEIKLQISIFVDEERPTKSKYKFKELEPFKCATTIHKGSIYNLGDAYGKFMPMVAKNGKHLTDQCREVYHKYYSPESPENITEIQIGIN